MNNGARHHEPGGKHPERTTLERQQHCFQVSQSKRELYYAYDSIVKFYVIEYTLVYWNPRFKKSIESRQE